MNRNQVLPQVELSADPKALSRIDFCAPQSYQGTGFLEISALPRVAEEASSIEPGDAFDWEVKTHFANSPGSEPQQILELAVKGRIHLVCQSCLQDFGLDLTQDSRFVLVATEEEADAFPMEDDQLEPLVASQHFDLLGLIEDEILLSMPLIPKHPEGACQPHASSFGEVGEAQDASEKPQNPFNILKNMKKN
ncbi:putative metal-binding, possibly nucleic acid-binding protein [Polynucleobacter duraquae]|uniref:Large ribosomal RNA subunit accumulation protein YceD n=1 Tax=Polynucleobacter duraquae TaxID=1835254 RepID=A0A0E3ZKV6_9BURK|nr:YceD family protein [Polynucleobacter duraquae]AKD25860.1 putative metal-binding, possibly nucleic acid-binding protein [Polynucleobacter duraquae]